MHKNIFLIAALVAASSTVLAYDNAVIATHQFVARQDTTVITDTATPIGPSSSDSDSSPTDSTDSDTTPSSSSGSESTSGSGSDPSTGAGHTTFSSIVAGVTNPSSTDSGMTNLGVTNPSETDSGSTVHSITAMRVGNWAPWEGQKAWQRESRPRPLSKRRLPSAEWYLL
ncbi:hypothetical protein F5Y13DRAFT_145494 [Hypoxylon sp. FL1857]|nr:hypothetical protein F5Y13DRAFT_145494 [Hypoxylon sp. FL1857]